MKTNTNYLKIFDYEERSLGREETIDEEENSDGIPNYLFAMRNGQRTIDYRSLEEIGENFTAIND